MSEDEKLEAEVEQRVKKTRKQSNRKEIVKGM